MNKATQLFRQASAMIGIATGTPRRRVELMFRLFGSIRIRCKVGALLVAVAFFSTLPLPEIAAGQNTLPTLTIYSSGGGPEDDLTASNTPNVTTFIVSLSRLPVQQVTVDYATRNGTATAGEDYTAVRGTLTFSGNTNGHRVLVHVTKDNIVEEDETFTMVLSNPAGATLENAEATFIIRNDDFVPTMSITDASVEEGDSGTTRMRFMVTLMPASDVQATVGYITADDSATAGEDYTATSGTLTFAAGVTTQTFDVSVTGDTLDEEEETFTVTLRDPTGTRVRVSPTAGVATGTIRNEDWRTVSIANASAVEDGQMSFMVTLDLASSRPVAVDYTTQAGTATAGEDYRTKSGTLTIAAGETSGAISVAVLEDALDEDDETFTVMLSTVDNGFISTTSGTATGTITDNDDLPTLAFGSTAVEANEGSNADPGSMSFTVTLTPASGREVWVDYGITASGTATAGEDYTAISGTLTFALGEISKSLTVQVIGDATDEVDETFSVRLEGAQNGNISPSAGTAVGTIRNDDTEPGLSIADARIEETQSGAQTLNFRVTLSARSGRSVTVDYGTEDDTATAGTDYTATRGTLTLAAGTSSGVIGVPIIGDEIHEGDESFTVVLSNPSNASLVDDTAMGTIQDNEQRPHLAIGNARLTEGNSGVANMTFTVRLFPASDSDVSVDYMTTDGSATAGTAFGDDYTATSGTLTFAAGTSSGVIGVPIRGDEIYEGDESFTVVLSSPSGATLQDATAVGTIEEDESESTLSIADARVNEGDTGFRNMLFTVSLAPVRDEEVAVAYATASGTAIAGTDYTAASGTLTFVPGETSQVAHVRVRGDSGLEDNETFEFRLLSSSVVGAVVGAENQATGTIVNDEVLPAISIANAEVKEDMRAPRNMNFLVTLNEAKNWQVTVEYATSSGSGTGVATAGVDYTATSGTLTFAPGQVSRTITVLISEDSDEEEDETFAVTLNSPSDATLGDATAIGTIRDRGGANTAPTIEAIADQANVVVRAAFARTEGRGKWSNILHHEVSMSASDAEGDSMQYWATTSLPYGVTPMASAKGTLNSDGSGTLTIVALEHADYVPADSLTSFTVTVHVSDGAETSARTFMVHAVPPTLQAPPNLRVKPGTQSSNGFTVTWDPTPGISLTLGYRASATPAGGGRPVAGVIVPAPKEALIARTFRREAVFSRLSPAASYTVSVEVANVRANPGHVGYAYYSERAVLEVVMPTLSIAPRSATVVEGGSGSKPQLFTINLNPTSDDDVTVAYATVAGTALAGTDYTGTSGTLTIAAGETSKTLTVQIAGDATAEADETFTVALSNVAGDNTYLPATGSTATVTITEALPALSITDASAAEGNSGTTDMEFVVTMTAANNREVTVAYATANGTAASGTDYAAKSGTLTFATGTTRRNITVQVAGDATYERDETFMVTLSNPSNAVLGGATASGTITNDESLPTFSIMPNSVSVNEGNSGSVAQTFMVAMTPANSDSVSVAYATADDTATSGADYRAVSGTLTFAAGEISKAFTVQVIGDTVDERDETFTVALSNVSGPNARISLTAGTATVTITKDLPTLSIADVSVAEGDRGSTDITLAAVLSGPGNEPVSVAYAIAEGTATAGMDYTAVSSRGTLTFAVGTTSQDITVQVAGDEAYEGDETFTVTLSNASFGAVLGDATATGTIVNDEAPPTLSIAPDNVIVTEGDIGSTAQTFTVAMSPASSRQVTVGYVSADGSATGGTDYTAASGTLTFAVGETSKTFTVQIAGDEDAERDEAFTVNLINASGLDARISLAEGAARVTIMNDENPLTLNIADANVFEGSRGTAEMKFTVTLSGVSGQPVTVAYASADGTATVAGRDYAAASGTLTFAPFETRKVLTVSIIGDADSEGNETFTVTLSSPAGAVLAEATATGTIRDQNTAPAIEAIENQQAIITIDNLFGFHSVSVSASDADGDPLQYWATTVRAGGSSTPGPYTTTPRLTRKGVLDSEGKGTVGFEVDELSDLSAITVTVHVSDGHTVSSESFDMTVTKGLPMVRAPENLRLRPGMRASNGFAVEWTKVLKLSVYRASVTSEDGSTVVATVDERCANSRCDAIFSGLPSAASYTVSVYATDIKSGFEAVYEGYADDGEAATLRVTMPALSIASGVSAIEGDGAIFAVHLNPVSSQSVTVAYATADGTATAGADYTVASGTLTFAAGTTAQTFSVPVTLDSNPEDEETFTVVLSNVAGDATYISPRENTATATIMEKPPTLSIAPNDVSVPEGHSSSIAQIFTVTMDRASRQQVTVDYETMDGTATAGQDYTAARGTLTFATTETSKTLTVQVTGDVVDESHETFTVSLSNVSGAEASISPMAGTAMVTITDDEEDRLALNIADVSLQEGNSGMTSMEFTVTMSGGTSNVPVTVAYATADVSAIAGTDYTVASGTVTFGAGTTSQSITVQVAGDEVYEEDESFTVTLMSPFGAALGDGEAIGTILNDDLTLSVTPGSVSVVEGDSGSTAQAFTVTLSKANSEEVTVTYATADGTATMGTDYVSTRGTLRFAVGETSKTLTVQVAGDGIVESDETFTVVLSNASGLSANISATAGTATVTIDNDDVLPTLSIADAAATPERRPDSRLGQYLTFEATLNPAYGEEVRVDYTFGGTATNLDYFASPGTLTFSPGSTSLTLSVGIHNDSFAENDETVVVRLRNPVNATLADSEATGTIIDVDSGPVLFISDIRFRHLERNSGTSNQQFTVALSETSNEEVTVAYATADGTAIAGTDYTATSGTLTFAPGTTTRTFNVPIIGDTLYEAYETFTVVLSSPSGAKLGDGETTLTIASIDTPPILMIRPGSVSVTEGTGGTTPRSFTVSLAKVSGLQTTVAYAPTSGSATEGTDYTAARGTLTIAAGTTSSTFTVQITGDALNENDETFTVALNSPSGASLSAIPRNRRVTVTIRDDDEPGLALLIADARVLEGDSGMEFTVTMNMRNSEPVTVAYATGDGTATAGQDYTATAGTLTFAAGTTTQTFTVPVIGDGIYEPNETFTATLSNPSSGARLASGEATGTILNDDASSTLSIAPRSVSVPEGTGGTTPQVLTVTMSLAISQKVTVDYATGDGTAIAGEDYMAVRGTLTIAANETSKTLTVQITGDATDENDETFTVALSDPSNATISALTGKTATVTIRDDDEAGLALLIEDARALEGDSSMEFTVTLNMTNSESVTVAYATGDGMAAAGEDYTTTSGILTFVAGTTTQTFNVPVIGDGIYEPNETFMVTLSNPSSGARLAVSEATGTILNDDASPTLSIAPASVLVTEGNSGSTAQTFTATMSPSSGESVTVAYATADGTAAEGADYTAARGTLTLAAGETSKTFTVQVIGDVAEEGDETFTVSLSSASGSGASISTTAGTATVTIDDEEAPPILSIADASVAEGHSGTVNMEFTVSMDKADSESVTVAYATADGSAIAGTDYTDASGILTFAASETSKTFSVSITGDANYERDETFTVSLSSPSGAMLGDAMATGTITNDDAPLTLSISDSSVEESLGSLNMEFTVTMSGASGEQATVDYVTADVAGTGAAIAGADYTATSGTLTIVAGETSGTISVVVAGDRTAERSETFTVTLRNPSGAVLRDATATGTIREEHNVAPVIIEPANRRDEGEVVVREGQVIHRVRVQATDANGHSLRYWGFTGNKARPYYSFRPDANNPGTLDANGMGEIEVIARQGSYFPAPGLPRFTVKMLVSDGLAISAQRRVFVHPIFQAPPDLRVSPRTQSSTGFTVEWGAVREVGSGNYRVLATPAGGGTAVEGRLVSGTTRALFSNLSLAASYTVSVRATVDSQDKGEAATLEVMMPTLSIAPRSATVTEGGQSGTSQPLTVNLNPASNGLVSVAYATADGSATAGTDYMAASGVLTFNPGVTSKTITVQIVGDATAEADETFTVALSSAARDNAYMSPSESTVTVTITESSPTLSIADASVVEGNSGTTSMEFTVALSATSNQEVTVAYITGDGNAIAGTDYTTTSGTLTFAAGTTSQGITVQVAGDGIYEEDETFTVTLSNPSGANATISTIAQTATGTITNDEVMPPPSGMAAPATLGKAPPTATFAKMTMAPNDVDDDPLTLNIADASVLEGANGTATMKFTVTMSGASDQRVTAGYSTADDSAIAGTDYTTANGTLTFAAGETSKIINVQVTGDELNEDDETFTVALGSPSGATLADATATGTIINDDTGQLSQGVAEEVERSAMALVESVIKAIEQRRQSAGTSKRAALSIAGHKMRASLQAQEELSRVRDPDSRLGEEEKYTDMMPTAKQLFDGTSFVIPLQFNAGAGDAARMEVWGRGLWQNMAGDGDRLNWDGSLRGAQFGMDARLRKELLAGLVVSWSDGVFDDKDGYRDDGFEGAYDNRMLSVHPWIAWSVDGGLDLWASAGYGEGEFTLAEANTGGYKSDTILQTVAAGASGPLLEQDALKIVLKGEGFFAKVDIEDENVPDVDANRMRLAVEGSWAHETASGGSLTPSLELGMRSDGGGSSGTGAEIGAGAVFVDHTGRLSLDLDGRVLVIDGDVQERGMSGVLRYAPDSEGRGLSLNVRSDWGTAASGMERLWEMGASSMVEDGLQTTLRVRMQAKIGYGLGYASGLLKWYGGIELQEDGNVRYLTGSRYTTSSSLELNLEGTHRTAGSESDSESGIMLKGTRRW